MKYYEFRTCYPLAVAIFITAALVFPSYIQSLSLADDHFVQNYLDKLKSGDTEAIRAILTEHYEQSFLKRLPMNIYIASHMKHHFASAGLEYEIHNVTKSENKISAVISNNLTGSWLALVIPLADSPTHKINGFTDLKPTSRPSDIQSTRKLSNKDIVRKLERCLHKLNAYSLQLKA